MRRAVVVAAAIVSTVTTFAVQDRGLAPAKEPPGRRLALVVGNDRYADMPLRNAVNDANAIAAALRSTGFDVSLAVDLSNRELTRRVEEFSSRLRGGDVALFFYAGHGLQIDGENYIVPIDFKAADEIDAKFDAYPMGRLADRIAASGPRLSILVLDACRNNPFRSTRSGSRGLAPMDSGRGSLVAFSTAPNRTADDNPRGANGLFTSFLLEAMQEPGLEIEQVFSRVRQKVYDASSGRQIPWLVSSLIGSFSFRPAAKPAESSTPVGMATSVAGATSAGNSVMFLNEIRGPKKAVFETAIDAFGRSLRASSRPAHQQQAATWRVFQMIEPLTGAGSMAADSTLYVFVIDPALTSADYSLSKVLAGLDRQQAADLYTSFFDAVAMQYVVNMEPVAGFKSTPPAAPTAIAPPADKDAWIFSSDAGLLLQTVKPDMAQQFEALMQDLRRALEKTTNPVRRQQALGWKMFKQTEPYKGGGWIYVSIFDPVVRGADYRFSWIVAEVFPELGQEFHRKWAETVSSINKMNLRLVNDLGKPR